jgi:hypothetical protein
MGVISVGSGGVGGGVGGGGEGRGGGCGGDGEGLRSVDLLHLPTPCSQRKFKDPSLGRIDRC